MAKAPRTHIRIAYLKPGQEFQFAFGGKTCTYVKHVKFGDRYHYKNWKGELCEHTDGETWVIIKDVPF